MFASMDVYITRTPYTILLATGLARLNRDVDNLLIVLNEFNSSEMVKAIIDSDQCPFGNVVVMFGSYGISSSLVRSIGRFLNLIRLKRILVRIDNGSKLYFNLDGGIEEQLASYLIKRKSGKNILVEEGAAAYICPTLPQPTRLYNRVLKLLFADWYQEIELYSTNRYVDELWMFIPEFSDEKLKGVTTKRLNKLVLETGNEVIGGIPHTLMPNPLDFPDICIICLPHSDVFRKHQIEQSLVSKAYRAIIESKENDIYLKYHPREKRNYMSQVSRHVNVLPKSIPLELIFLNSAPKIVIGDISTSLITAKIILGNRTTVISIIRLLGSKLEYASVVEKFRLMGIHCPDNFDELKSLISLHEQD